MERLRDLLQDCLQRESLLYLVLSGVRRRVQDGYTKVSLKPILLQGELHYHFTYHYPRKVTHRNLDPAETLEEVLRLSRDDFRQVQAYSAEADYQIFINKGGEVRILTKPPTRQPDELDLSHNRRKNYLLPEGTPHGFLVHLGVMNRRGQVLAARYDKFRQINRFLELVADVVDVLPLPAWRPLSIVDFGCGKSYLTFALYYYLREIRGMDLQISGLDLKEDVVSYCNQVAQQLNYDRLSFQVGEISQYAGQTDVDLVVTLHACDTATDDALAQAVRWGARAILSVPCCQHELFRQIANETMWPLLKHGIIKERLASLITDSLRANVLEIMGYSVQILEFISTEHTPKNLMIRAVRRDGTSAHDQQRLVRQYLGFRDSWGISDPYIERAFGAELRERLDAPETSKGEVK